jgi:hypothetical protein
LLGLFYFAVISKRFLAFEQITQGIQYLLREYDPTLSDKPLSETHSPSIPNIQYDQNLAFENVCTYIA